MTTASGFVPSLVAALEGLAAALQRQHRSHASAFSSHASASMHEVSAMLRHLQAFLLTNIFTPALIADPSHNPSASYLRCLIHRVELDLYALLVSSSEFANLPTRLLAAMLIKSLAAISPSSPPSLFAASRSGSAAAGPPAAWQSLSVVSASTSFESPLPSADPPARLRVSFDVHVEGERDAAAPFAARGAPADGPSGDLGSPGAVAEPSARPAGPDGAAAAFGHLPGFFFTNFGGNMALYSPRQLGAFLGLLAELHPADLLVANVENLVAWVVSSPHARTAEVTLPGLVTELDGEDDAADFADRFARAGHSAGLPQGGTTLTRLLERIADGKKGGVADAPNPALSAKAPSAPERVADDGPSRCARSARQDVSSLSSRLAASETLRPLPASRGSILTSLFPSSPGQSQDRGPTSVFSSLGEAGRAGPKGEGDVPAKGGRLHFPPVSRLVSSDVSRSGVTRENLDAPYPSSGGGAPFFIFAPPVGYGACSASASCAGLPTPPLALRQAALSCLLALLRRCFCASEDAFSVVGKCRRLALDVGDSRGAAPGGPRQDPSSPFPPGDRPTGDPTAPGAPGAGLGGAHSEQARDTLLEARSGGDSRRTGGAVWCAALRRVVRRIEAWGVALLLSPQGGDSTEETQSHWTILRTLWGGAKRAKAVLEADGKPCREMFTCLCIAEDYSDDHRLNVQFFSSIYAWLVTVYHRQIALARRKQIGEEAIFKLTHFGFLPYSTLVRPSVASSRSAFASASALSALSPYRQSRAASSRLTSHVLQETPAEEDEEDEEEDAAENRGPERELDREGEEPQREDGVHDLVQRLVQMTMTFDERSMPASLETPQVGQEEVDGRANEAAGEERAMASPEPSRASAAYEGVARSSQPPSQTKSTNLPRSEPPSPSLFASSESPSTRHPSSFTSSSNLSASSAPRRSHPPPSASSTAAISTAAVSTAAASSHSSPQSSASVSGRLAVQPRGGGSLVDLLPMNRRLLAALATYCLRLLAQVERQQSLRRQEVVRMREKSEKASLASLSSKWSLWRRGAASKDQRALSRLASAAALRDGSAETEIGAFPTGRLWNEENARERDDAKRGVSRNKNPFSDGVQLGGSPVWSLGQHAGISEAVWDLQMSDAVGVEAMRILDLVCRADAEFVAAVFPTIKRVCERTLAGGGGLHLFTCVFHFYLHHHPHQLLSLDSFVQQYVTHLGLHYRSVLLSMNALTFLNNNLQALVVKTNIFTRYFPVIFKLVAYHPRAAGSLLLPLLPAIVGPSTLMEVLHSLLDLPLTASFLERFDEEGAAAACFFASSFFSSSKEVCSGAAALSASAAAGDGACPFLRALKTYLLRNEAGGRNVIWEAEDNEEVIANIELLWRRLPITSRLSAVCKVVPAVLQVYFRVVLDDAPPFYIEKVLRVLLERFLLLCPVEFYMDAMNRLFLSMILQIFHRHPMFVITLRTQILHAVYRHLTVRGALLSRHLCWVMGEYSSPHLLAESGMHWSDACFSEDRPEPTNGASASGSALAPTVSQTGATLFAGFFDALESLAYEAIASVGPIAAGYPSASATSRGRSPPISSGNAFPPSAGVAPQGAPGLSPAGFESRGDTARPAGEVWGGPASSAAAPGEDRSSGEGARPETSFLSSDPEETDSEDLSEFSSDESGNSEEEREDDAGAVCRQTPADEVQVHRDKLKQIFTPCFICVVITAMTKFALRYPQFMPRVVLCFSKLSNCFATGEYASVRARVETCLHMTATSSACASILQACVLSPAGSVGAAGTSLDASGLDRSRGPIGLNVNTVHIPHLHSLGHYCRTPYNFVPGPRLHLFELPSYPVPGASGASEGYLAQRLFTGRSLPARQNKTAFGQWRCACPRGDFPALPDQSGDSLCSRRERFSDAACCSEQGVDGPADVDARGGVGATCLSRSSGSCGTCLVEEFALPSDRTDYWPFPVGRNGAADFAEDADAPGPLFAHPRVTQMLLRRQMQQLGYAGS
ncbi:KIAA0415, related [Neospora caninum Liverpool]|uniref:KIAA0415, related n=1 Tax=Neospora caninum (strain Liverpool) TaxID=572307 RepID=F0VQJ1_NEOCL|nr:KIAA0415, related [Neospora caninum Liverpool]CBZ55988.1 KIAA0415, related [Neospora caninum Liverpool]CEL70734.1 TPA: KIAA0415, related [Neospora caninum Liverpool]|eukprot:XP_003886014.1 KIAA0415, related [Neospora caninum Liverpool]